MSYHMAEKNPKKTRIPNDYLSDSDSSEEETSQHLRTSPEERLYNTIKATQAALAHTTAQCNPTVKRGPAKQPRIKKLPKGQLQINQHRQKRKISLINTPILFSNILYSLYQNTFDITQMCVPYIKMNVSSWRKAVDLIAQGTQANQQVQAAATADSSQLESFSLSSLSADDSSPPQVNYGTEQPLAVSTPRESSTSTQEIQATDTYLQIIPGMSECLYPTLAADG